jgi:transcription elongation factor GreA
VAIFFKSFNFLREANMPGENFVYLTKERLVELEKVLKEMKTNGRKEIAAKIAEARAHGDLSENAEYEAAKEEQGLFELKLSKLENTLSRARIIDKSQFPQDQIHILSKVKIKNIKTKKVFDYLLVSPEESDFQEGKISVTSPVGKGLMGAKLGDKIKVKAPAGLLEFEILNID